MSQTRQWIDTLKRCLKARGITYKDVAAALELSEASNTCSNQATCALFLLSALLSYFYLLLNGWKTARIAKRFALDEPRQIRLLVRLDRLGLIELQPDNQVRLLTARQIHWRRDGPVRRMYEKEVKQAFLLDEFAESTSLFGFESAELAPESARLIRRKLNGLAREFDELAELDVNLEPGEKRGYGLMVALRPWAYWNIVLKDNH